MYDVHVQMLYMYYSLYVLIVLIVKDQDDQLWHYIRTQIMGNDEHEIQKPVLDIQKPILTTTEQKMKNQGCLYLRNICN